MLFVEKLRSSTIGSVKWKNPLTFLPSLSSSKILQSIRDDWQLRRYFIEEFLHSSREAILVHLCSSVVHTSIRNRLLHNRRGDHLRWNWSHPYPLPCKQTMLEHSSGTDRRTRLNHSSPRNVLRVRPSVVPLKKMELVILKTKFNRRMKREYRSIRLCSTLVDGSGTSLFSGFWSITAESRRENSPLALFSSVHSLQARAGEEGVESSWNDRGAMEQEKWMKYLVSFLRRFTWCWHRWIRFLSFSYVFRLTDNSLLFLCTCNTRIIRHDGKFAFIFIEIFMVFRLGGTSEGCRAMTNLLLTLLWISETCRIRYISRLSTTTVGFSWG